MLSITETYFLLEGEEGKVKGEGTSVQIACKKSKITYLLDNERRGEVISTDHMWQIQGHLQPGRWRERGIHQCSLDVTNPRSLTCWKVNGKGNSSTQITCNKCEITYILEDERRRELIIPDCMQQIQGHLQTGRWKEREIHQHPDCMWQIQGHLQTGRERDREIHQQKWDATIPGHLHPIRWKEREIHQHKSHATNPRLLTN